MAAREEAMQRGKSGGCPFPIRYRARDNPITIEPEFAVVREQVYRDKWERIPPRSTQ
ncbi:hypothetical protein Micbo1qcDRAFT_161922, partial [Microdochium bolleyi]